MLEEFFCQYPRFAIHAPGFKQRSPVSIYMRYDAVKSLTYYIVAAPESEECVNGFQNILNLVSDNSKENDLSRALLSHPIEAHILLAKISCESSQGYINLFRQSMFAQVLPPHLHPPPNADIKPCSYAQSTSSQLKKAPTAKALPT